MSWTEVLGFVTGAVCVWLTVRAKVWNFPVGMANNVFFLLLFWGAGLYADAGLQVVFLVLAAHGWWQWVRGGERRLGREVRYASARETVLLGLLLVPVTAGLAALLGWAHGSAPFWDALTTALSLVAQWLLNTKKVQTWWFWIAADLVYVPLYAAKGLYLTSVVYLLFLGLCVAGLRGWRRAAAPEPAVGVAA
ncbi:nicotinamide riboside transporter PnuC [Kitasatospora albolonga]|uniref:nicotinamide riboside transporter PnuC n=1 Tax=Kitasatospora albolonga TaxID=68173 RepID=UPI0031E8E0A3